MEMNGLLPVQAGGCPAIGPRPMQDGRIAGQASSSDGAEVIVRSLVEQSTSEYTARDYSCCFLSSGSAVLSANLHFDFTANRKYLKLL
jgi:hypothetical protein